jgi:subtilisin family serine protease
MKTKHIAAAALLSSLTVFSTAQTVQSWMHTDVGAAWKLGYKGQNTNITVVDDFKSRSLIQGKLTNVIQSGRHGQWTAFEASLIAPSATIRAQDYTAGTSIPLAKGLNVINLSYGMMAPKGYSAVGWSAQESSIINHAKKGAAIVSKAAGNDGSIAVGAATRQGQIDYLNRDLIGAKTAIFVGALNSNGSTAVPATMASYSNIAGSNTVVQNQFISVGVESSKTGLAGTSFAAPIVTGYAAILGSKFQSATPVQITNQLLSTARKDTIRGYNPAIHGRGEASLSRALAPVTIK